MMGIWPATKPAVLAAVTVLDAEFTNYAMVSVDYPGKSRPDRFVRVSRTGGARDSVVTDSARILIEVFAREYGELESMTARASAALRNAAGSTVHAPINDTETVPMFVRFWSEESVADYNHPDILDFRRRQVFGTLSVKAN